MKNKTKNREIDTSFNFFNFFLFAFCFLIIKVTSAEVDKKIRKKSPNPSNGYLCVCIEGGGVVILHNIYI